MKFLVYLKKEGYMPYCGAVDAAVYEYLDCPDPGQAKWLHKPGSFQCTGCGEYCETDSPCGFQLFLTDFGAASSNPASATKESTSEVENESL